MKALTISQPFASLIANGEKWVENRSWWTGHRGELAIHAGKGTQYLSRKELSRYPTAAVIAIADLVACVRLDALLFAGGDLRRAGITAEQLQQHAHTEGPYCWILKRVREIDPIAINGAQGLWDWRPAATIGPRIADAHSALPGTFDFGSDDRRGFGRNA